MTITDLGFGGSTSRGFTVSAQILTGEQTPDLAGWLAERLRATRFEVERIPFDRLNGWYFEPGSGNLVHSSGKYFAIEGLQVSTDLNDRDSWMQPIINQPEIGVLGIIVKSFHGVPHFLLQAKMEPGNVNTLQLSPTVQATRSNYTRVHGGGTVPYLEYFMHPRRGRVLVDSIQSEQGSWFLYKRNRNMVVEVTEDVPLLENFCWLTIGQVHELLRLNNVINMDTRTVLACVPFEPPNGGPRTEVDETYRQALLCSLARDQWSMHTVDEILSWMTEAKARYRFARQYVPLSAVDRWKRGETAISHENGRYFDVIAVDVMAGNREVVRWTQPMLTPVEQGRVAFLVRSINGVLHLLVHVRLEAGVLNIAELAPTLQCSPTNTSHLPEHQRPRYLDDVLNADPARIRYDAVQSEEGGRFYHAETRYQIIDVGEDFELAVPDDFRWITVRQLTELLRHSNYLNIQARSMLAALHTTW
jgi:dTDP-4-dehydro-6-deoxy-alpha-D-glucopyranose 2,3-dehydratase